MGINEWMERYFISSGQLADLMKVSPSTVWTIRRFKREITPKIAQRIFKVTCGNVTPADLRRHNQHVYELRGEDYTGTRKRHK